MGRLTLPEMEQRDPEVFAPARGQMELPPPAGESYAALTLAHGEWYD